MNVEIKFSVNHEKVSFDYDYCGFAAKLFENNQAVCVIFLSVEIWHLEGVRGVANKASVSHSMEYNRVCMSLISSSSCDGRGGDMH